MTPGAPHLQAWFDILDSADPDRVLRMISDDFQMAVVFSRGEGATAEFNGDRAGLVAYLAQRERGALKHHVLVGAADAHHELVLGRVTRDGAFEASFNASAMLDGRRLLRRLLICRTPELAFPDPD